MLFFFKGRRIDTRVDVFYLTNDAAKHPSQSWYQSMITPRRPWSYSPAAEVGNAEGRSRADLVIKRKNGPGCYIEGASQKTFLTPFFLYIFFSSRPHLGFYTFHSGVLSFLSSSLNKFSFYLLVSCFLLLLYLRVNFFYCCFALLSYIKGRCLN